MLLSRIFSRVRGHLGRPSSGLASQSSWAAQVEMGSFPSAQGWGSERQPLKCVRLFPPCRDNSRAAICERPRHPAAVHGCAPYPMTAPPNTPYPPLDVQRWSRLSAAVLPRRDMYEAHLFTGGTKHRAVTTFVIAGAEAATARARQQHSPKFANHCDFRPWDCIEATPVHPPCRWTSPVHPATVWAP